MDFSSVQLVVMNQIGQWASILVDQLRSALFALAVFILGLAVAELARTLGAQVLRAVRWDAFCERVGASAVLRKFRADVSPSTATAAGLFWIILISFFMKALERLDIAWLARLGRSYFEILPAAGKALVILLLAGWAACGLARLLLRAIEHPAAYLGAGLAQAVVFSLALYASLTTLGLDRGLAQPVALIALAAAAFAVALAWALNRHAWFQPVVRVPDVEEGE